ncbi:MAG: hypothetical protein LN417_04215 [Candidatus Thermoplasmatota archaeon]|nr:hypothetical protein [Candidatus Thermoplasmatota archaeon]
MLVKEVSDLKPIVEKAIKGNYGEDVANIKVTQATKGPMFGIERSWSVWAEFEDKSNKYSVNLGVEIATGLVDRFSERGRQLLE